MDISYSTMDLAMLVIVLVVICIATRFRINERGSKKKLSGNNNADQSPLTVPDLL